MAALQCPFPTAEACNCLYGFLASGFSPANVTTYPNVLDENSVETYYLTGQWYGLDGIPEYNGFFGGDFYTDLEVIGPQIFYLSESTAEECVLTSVGATRTRSKPKYSVNGISQCIDFVGALFLKFVLTGNPVKPILVTTWDGYTPAEFLPALLGAIDSPVTDEYVCDSIVNLCSGDNHNDKNDNYGRRRRRGKKSKCLKRLAALDGVDNGYWADGNTQYCRILHNALVRNNPMHCPHVTFEFEPDNNGKIKCYQSQGWTAQDLFTPTQLAYTQAVTLPYATSSSIDPYFAAYPDGNCPDLI